MFEVGVGPILYGFELIYSIILRYHFDFSWGLLTLKATNVVSKLHMYPHLQHMKCVKHNCMIEVEMGLIPCWVILCA